MDRHPLLTREEEQALGRRIRAGDRAAFDELVARNEGLVRKIAWRYRGLGLDLDDLVQCGSLGCMTAARRFDPDRGCRFSTYASWWIRQAIEEGIGDGGFLIRVPGYAHRLLSAAERARRARRARRPLELSSSDRDTLAAARSARRVRLDCDIRVAGPAAERLSCDRLVERVALDRREPAPDEEATADEAARERSRLAEELLSRLDPWRRDLMERRYGLGAYDGRAASLAEIAAEVGRTRDSVRSKVESSLTTLKRLYRDGSKAKEVVG